MASKIEDEEKNENFEQSDKKEKIDLWSLAQQEAKKSQDRIICLE